MSEPDHSARIEEEVYIRYYTGDGNVYYIDPIHDLLMQKKQNLAGSIHIKKYSADAIDKSLAEAYDLHPFDPDHPGLAQSTTFLKLRTSEERMQFYSDSLRALNDDRATLSEYITNSGKAMRSVAHKVVPIIQELAPGWHEDINKKAQRLTELANAHASAMTASSGIISFSTAELTYEDQAPSITDYGSGEKNSNALIYHSNGLRYYLKEGQPLMIMRNGGKTEQVTEERIQKLREAIQKSGDDNLIQFLNTYLNQQ